MTIASEPAGEPTREQQIQDLRDLTNWFEAHPEIPIPAVGFTIYRWDSKEEAQIMARAMGTFSKETDDYFLKLKKSFGSIEVSAVFTRDSVCQREVVGTKEVEVEEVDAAALAALPKVKVTKQVDIVAWRCPSLMKGDAEAVYNNEIATAARDDAGIF